jgi:hypothetical protein
LSERARRRTVARWRERDFRLVFLVDVLCGFSFGLETAGLEL